MKNLFCISAILLAFGFYGCKKTLHSSDTVYKGVIVESICGDLVVQCIGPNFTGQQNWIDSNRLGYPVLNHVFRIANPCNYGNGNMKDTFNFHIVGTQVQNCVMCMAALPYMPDSLCSIKVID